MLVLQYEELVRTGQAATLSPLDLKRRILVKGKVKLNAPAYAQNDGEQSFRRSPFLCKSAVDCVELHQSRLAGRPGRSSKAVFSRTTSSSRVSMSPFIRKRPPPAVEVAHEMSRVRGPAATYAFRSGLGFTQSYVPALDTPHPPAYWDEWRHAIRQLTAEQLHDRPSSSFRHVFTSDFYALSPYADGAS